MNKNIALTRYRDVLKVDVIANSMGDFLATHVPFKKIYLVDKLTTNANISDSDKESKTYNEEEIFEEIVEPKEIDQFNLVIGSSGSGKSHLIRWLGATFEKRKPDNEALLFIRRNDNTLKGTIKQLLEIPEIKNLPNRETYRKLTNAAVTVPEQELKTMIYYNFINKIENDDEIIESETNKLKHAYRKPLIALMQNIKFKKMMMQEGGAVDRIYSKFAESKIVQKAELIGFLPDDFLITPDFRDELEKDGADRDAIRMADKILQNSDLQQQIANYLNSYIEKVIQMCIAFEPGDLRQIFVEIRQELRKQNKNLTMFIEDITAFTGVNEALLDALMTPHTGDYENDYMCRINAIVGSTSGYYKDSFRDNHKQRISNFIVIPDEIFDENQEHEGLIEFFAKYLNTLSLTSDEIEKWANAGAKSNDYPIHEVDLGKKWDFYELNDGKKINLFPFSKNAIVNLYNLQNHEQRTPRLLIRNIIEPYLMDALNDIKHYPSKNRNIFVDSIIDDDKLRRVINSNSSKYENDILLRLIKFMYVWGDGTNNVYEKDGEEYIGNINSDIYKELDLPIIKGDIISQPEKKNIKKPVEKISPHEIYDKESIDIALSEIHKWIENETYKLNVSSNVKGVKELSEARKNINNYLYETIDWVSEGIPIDIVEKYKNTNSKYFVSFERQTTKVDALIELPAEVRTEEILEAFIRWNIQGNNSWKFESATDYLQTVEIWLDNIKTVIKKRIMLSGTEKTKYFNFSLAYEILRKIVNGEFANYHSLDKLSVDLLLKKEAEISHDNYHCQTWNNFKNKINNQDSQEVSSIVLRYYNLPQGAQLSSNMIELDYVEFEKEFNKVIEKKFNYSDDDYQINDPFKKRGKVSELLKQAIADAKTVISEELNYINNQLKSIEMLVALNKIDDDEIEEICEKAKKFYQQASRSQISVFEGENKDRIDFCNENSKRIVNAIDVIKEVKNSNEISEQLLLLSVDPMKYLGKFVAMLGSLNSDITRANTEVDSKIGTLNVPNVEDEDFADAIKKIEESNTILKEMFDNYDN